MRFQRFVEAIGGRKDIDPVSRFHLAFLGSTLFDNPDAFLARIPATSDPSNGWNPLLNAWSAERLNGISDDPGNMSPLIGFLFAGSYRHQLLPLARGLAARGHRVVGILDHREWGPGKEDALAPYLELSTVALPDPTFASRLGSIGLVFAPDTAWRLLEHIPKTVKRAALQHGLTATVDYSIAYEGGGTVFDHILLPEAVEDMPEDILRGIFPRSLVRHGSDRLALVPSGWPKLDDMIRAFESTRATPARKVAVHLSVQDHDSSEGMRILPEAIEQMLSWDPPVEVLFRPFPGISYPFAESVLARFAHRPGFRVSSAESYVEDYKDASALVTLKETTAEIFPLATGIPSFCLIPERTAGPFSRGWICTELDDLLDRIRRQFENPWLHRDRIFVDRDRTYFHVGRCLDALSESIPAMLSGESRPGWIILPLFDESRSDDPQDHLHALERLADQPRYAVREYDVQVVRSALNRFPGSVEILHAASRCLLRIARRHQCMRPGQRLAAHHLCFAELFLLVFAALDAIQKPLSKDHPELVDGIRALEQDALQMCLVLDWAQAHVPGYRFQQLDKIRCFVSGESSTAEDIAAVIGSYVLPHPNLPLDPGALANAVLAHLVERGTRLMLAGAIDRAESVFSELPRISLDPKILRVRLEFLLSPEQEPNAPRALLRMLQANPDLKDAWNALGVSLAEHLWSPSDALQLRSILTHVFEDEDRLAILWNAAREGRNADALVCILDFLESRADVPASLLEDLRASIAA